VGTTTLDPKNAEAAIQYVSPTDTSVSTGNWSKALLTLIGAPVNDSNVANIQTWLAHEQNPTSWAKGAQGETAQQIQSNPLGVDGAGNHPGSIFEGLIETAQALLDPANAQYGYPLIVGSLQSNTQETSVGSSGGKLTNPSGPSIAFANAVTASGWQSGKVKTPTGGGSYGGVGSSFLGRGQLEVNPEGLFGQAVGKQFDNGLNYIDTNTPSSVKKVLSEGAAVAGLIGDLTDPQKLKNVGIFVLGAVLVVGGLVIFFAATKPGQDVGYAAKDGAMVAA